MVPLAVAKDVECVGATQFFMTNLLLPVIVAVATYILTDRLGVWRTRRALSRLGMAIVASLQEEVKNGINLMTGARDSMRVTSAEPPRQLLPRRSWSGMSTIFDDVFLRILETSAHYEYSGFHPRDIRSHCKNYFDHMCENYDNALRSAQELYKRGQDWRTPFHEFLNGSDRDYVASAQKVDAMLKTVKQLLSINSRKCCPK